MGIFNKVRPNVHKDKIDNMYYIDVNNRGVNQRLAISIEKISRLEEMLNYEFKNKETIRSALRHSSIKRVAIPFERLEFLGDRILGVVIAEYIYRSTKGDEGGMARMHSALVCADACYSIALHLGLNEIVKTAGKHLRNNKTVLADAMEAVLGAVFTDSGRDYLKVEEIVLNLWRPLVLRYKASEQEPKTQLQELVQSRSNAVPVYTLLEVSGAQHQPVFKVQVSALGKSVETLGHSKKEAETIAARELLHLLRNEN